MTEHETEPTRIGSMWVWPDGTTLPVVSGGSDTMDASTDAPDAGSGPEPQGFAPEPVETEEPEVEVEPQAEGDPFDDESNAQFSRDYVRKLREEAAGHRTKAQRYEEAFSGLHEQDASWLLDSTRLLKQDPKAWARSMTEAAKAILEDDEPDALADAQAQAAAEGKTLTAEEVRAIIAEERANAEKESAVRAEREKIDAFLKENGYEPDSVDARHVQLMALQEKITIEEAHRKFVEAQEARIAKMLEDKRKANGAHAPVAKGAPASSATNLDDVEWGSPEWRRLVEGG